MNMPLPRYINPEVWQAFCEMRKKMGKSRPFTEFAAVLILKKLGELKDNGFDPNACLEQSIERGWAGVFQAPSKAIVAQSLIKNDWLQEQAAYDAQLSEPDQRARSNEARAKAMDVVKQFKPRRVA
jgi:hypothetical protein